MTVEMDATTLDAFADAGLALLGVPVDPAWREGIRSNLRASLALAAQVSAFALPDEADLAPVFSA